MAGELVDVGHELRRAAGGRGAAHPAPEHDRLAGDFALEGAEDQLLFCRGARVEHVEAGPVHFVAGRGQGVQGVPEEGGGVGGVAVGGKREFVRFLLFLLFVFLSWSKFNLEIYQTWTLC